MILGISIHDTQMNNDENDILEKYNITYMDGKYYEEDTDIGYKYLLVLDGGAGEPERQIRYIVLSDTEYTFEQYFENFYTSDFEKVITDAKLISVE